MDEEIITCSSNSGLHGTASTGDHMTAGVTNASHREKLSEIKAFYDSVRNSKCLPATCNLLAQTFLLKNISPNIVVLKNISPNMPVPSNQP